MKLVALNSLCLRFGSRFALNYLCLFVFLPRTCLMIPLVVMSIVVASVENYEVEMMGLAKINIGLVSIWVASWLKVSLLLNRKSHNLN